MFACLRKLTALARLGCWTPTWFLLLAALARIAAAQPAAMPVASPAPQSFSLNLIDAPGGVVVELVDLVRLLESLYPGARSRWDAQHGMMRIEVAGHRFDALAGHAIVILDGKIQSVARPLAVNQGKILLPVESVQAMLRALNLDFELQTRGGTAMPTTTPISAPTAALSAAETTGGLPAALPRLPEALPAAPQPAAATEATSPVAAPSVNLAMLIGGKPLAPQAVPTGAHPPLQPPAGLTPQIGLTWDRLADAGHRIPPERIALVCDAALASVANGARDRLNERPTYQAQVIVAPSERRDQEALRRDVVANAPELLVDLAAMPAAGDDPAPPLMVWVVHEALWPGDRSGPPPADDPTRAYQPHQFQSLALGSLLRGELAAQFPDRLAIYELAPAYLLRRTAAPSAAILIPVQGEGAQRRPALNPERLAQAVAAAVMDYAEGIRGTL